MLYVTQLKGFKFLQQNVMEQHNTIIIRKCAFTFFFFLVKPILKKHDDPYV